MAHAVFDEPEFPRSTPAVYWLIGLCVAVFFVQETVVNPELVQRALGYSSGDIHQKSLWTVVTYMFVHQNLMHLALNMITLWIFGPRVERAWGSGTFTWFYLWCGFGGWLLHYMLSNGNSVLIGASAAILGVAVAYASRWPDEEVLVFGVVPMKVKYFVGFMVALNFVMMFVPQENGQGGGTAYAAHLGGIVAAWIYLHAPTARSLDRFRSRIAPAPDYGDDPPRAVPKSSRPRERDVDDIVAQSKAAVARVRPAAPSSQPAVVAPVVNASAVDAVLDKSAAHGLESLSMAERMVLEEMSRKLRDR
jgi:membrane associated rhomboid family serine protease